jgi:flagellar biosynthesis/type III secretory pathway protein FliH
MKSESMKKVNAIYKDLNVKSLDELKELISFKEKYTELDGKFTALSDEYGKYKSDNEAVIKEREDLTKQLALSKLGITEDKDMREDFIMAVEALASKKEMTFDKAAEEYISRHPEFKNVSFRNGLKIGSEKSGVSEDLEDGVTKAFKKANPWYK